jgi:CRP-like cAMP-binding protein
MSEPVRSEEVGGLGLFTDLDPAVLTELAGCAHRRPMTRGEVLFQAGDPLQAIYGVRSGHVQLSRLAADGSEKVVEIIGPGETFAEAVLFMQREEYPVDARALEGGELLSLEAGCLNRLLDGHPSLARQLLGSLSRRLHSLVQDVESLALQDATSRVVGFLLARGEGAPEEFAVQLPAKKAAVASRLGVQPETFSRVLGRLRQGGVIAVEGDRIRVLDPEALRASAEGS